MQNIDPVSPIADEPEEPESRKEAIGYVSYRSLMSSGRAIKKSGHDLILQFAGDAHDVYLAGGKRKRRVRYMTGKDAKRGQHYLLTELCEARTDHQYNQILLAILEMIGNTIRAHREAGSTPNVDPGTEIEVSE